MVIAQALGEYGAMAGVAAAFQSAVTRAESVLGNLDGRDYIVIAVVVVVLLKVFSRRG